MQGSNWPQHVCTSCVIKLDEMCRFRKDVIDNQILIEQKYGAVVLSSHDPMTGLPRSFIQIETAAVVDVEEGEKNVTAPLGRRSTTRSTVLAKKTADSSSRITRTPRNRDDKKESQIELEEEDATETEILDLPLDEEESSISVPLDDDDNEEEDDEEEDTTVDNKSGKYKDVDETISNFMKLNCTLCSSKDFKTFTQLRYHYTKQHNSKGFVMCCNIKHLRRHKLYEHIQYHMDPKRFLCEVCQKTFNSSHNLKTHVKMTHLPEDLKKYFCEKCDKRFGTAFQLKQHQMTHVGSEERTFKCDTCSKMFPGRPHLLSHIRLVHEKRKPYNCDQCDRSFTGKVFLVNHVAAVHTEGGGAPKKVQCSHCDKFFANETSMKKHLSRLNKTGEKFICKECGHESPNKTAMRGHMTRNHDPNRRTFVCTTCGKQFKTMKTLTEHNAVHTGEILYSCLFCTKQFNSNANKYSHQKKVHPEEWAAENNKKSMGLK